MKRVVFGSIPTAPILCRCACTSCSFAVGRTHTNTDLYLYSCCCTSTRDSIHHVCVCIQYVFVYIYIVSLLHLCATLCTNTHVGLRNWNHYTRDRFRARAHLIIDRALLLRPGLSRGGSTCWITLTDHYRCVIVVYSRIVAFSASFVARNSCFDGDSVFVLPYLKELL